MIKQSQCPRLILASNSPRRRYLLEQAGLEFSVIPSNINEDAVSLPSPDAYTRKLAECKARDISDQYPDSWVIGADTIVVIDDIILGKPDSEDDARRMLKKLSGETHQVITGYCVCCKNKNRFFLDTIITDVQFRDLSDEEIAWYIDTGEPFDKAGAYAIQGLGVLLVKRINGSYTNVVGLPVCEIAELLIKEGVTVLNIKSS
ncbi:MAG: Maf family protein [Desulfobacterales bacterium]|jgi:septum formation protein